MVTLLPVPFPVNKPPVSPFKVRVFPARVTVPPTLTEFATTGPVKVWPVVL
jgi:hypothetical protein